MFRAGIAPDEAEDAGGLDARQGRQRSTAQFLPEQVKDFYGSSVLYIMRHGKTEWNERHKLQGRTDIP